LNWMNTMSELNSHVKTNRIIELFIIAVSILGLKFKYEVQF
jgi:hypothetical protein